KKMKRFVCVSGQKDDREETEDSSKHSTESVSRLSVFARCVFDLDFGDPEPAIAREHWDVPVLFAVDHDFVEHRAAIAFESAVDVVQRHAGEHPGHDVVDL